MITKINIEDKTIKSYAIRKLTPKECFRLMGVRDSVIAIMQTTVKKVRNVVDKVTGLKNQVEVEEYQISASQQYKQAGNSIVVDCLYEIFDTMFYPEQKDHEIVIKSDNPIKADVTINVAEDGQMSFF